MNRALVQECKTLPESPSSLSFLLFSNASKVGNMETPNQLSREAIEEFRTIYEEEFGKRLTDDQVQEIALRLLRFFGVLNMESPDQEAGSVGEQNH
jgi:hypothetical protein